MLYTVIQHLLHLIGQPYYFFFKFSVKFMDQFEVGCLLLSFSEVSDSKVEQKIKVCIKIVVSDFFHKIIGFSLDLEIVNF